MREDVIGEGKRNTVQFTHQRLEDFFVVKENKWIEPYEEGHFQTITKRNPDYVKMAKKKTPIFMLGDRNDLKRRRFPNKIPLPYNKFNQETLSLMSSYDLLNNKDFRYGSHEWEHNERKKRDLQYNKILERKKMPTYRKMEEIQSNYPRLQGGKTDKVIYRKTWDKANLSLDNLRRMNRMWSEKGGYALAITNGSIVIFMGMCSS